MKADVVPVDRTAAVNAALETACPVIAAYLRRTLRNADENAPHVTWKYEPLVIGARDLSRGTPKGERGMSYTVATAATQAGRLMQTLLKDEDDQETVRIYVMTLMIALTT